LHASSVSISYRLSQFSLQDIWKQKRRAGEYRHLTLRSVQRIIVKITEIAQQVREINEGGTARKSAPIRRALRNVRARLRRHEQVQ